MKSAGSFVISEFTNPSGEVVFRVSGQLDGKRIRKNLDSRTEAQAERQTLEIVRLQAESGVRTAVTRLTDSQLKEAEAAFHRLDGPTRSLAFYLEFALTNYRDPVHDLRLAEATAQYLALRESDHKQGHLSHRQFTSFRCEFRAINVAFRGKTVSELTAPALTEFFKRGNASRKTYNNRRGLLSTFLKYCVLKDWVADNVITKVPHFRGVGYRRGSAPALSAPQCAEIMLWAEDTNGGALVPFVALCLFAGIRPDLYEGEISKLDAREVRLDTGVILIEPNVSKVRMKRSITIQPNLATWLRAFPLTQFPISRDSVAGHFRVSPNHVSRLFKNEGMVAFNDYINYVRINRAKYFLKNRRQTMDEVAVSCGYSNASYFCRVFKKMTASRPARTGRSKAARRNAGKAAELIGAAGTAPDRRFHDPARARPPWIEGSCHHKARMLRARAANAATSPIVRIQW